MEFWPKIVYRVYMYKLESALMRENERGAIAREIMMYENC